MKDIRTTIYIAGMGFLLVLILLAVLFYNNRNSPGNNTGNITPVLSRPSATPFLISPTAIIEKGPTPTVDPPISGTGASDDSGLTSDQEKAINESFALQTKLPLSFSQFSLRYENREFKFYATIYDPYSSNLLYFRNWIKTNGYESIPESDFIIVRGSK